jgi:hypothetical protein
VKARLISAIAVCAAAGLFSSGASGNASRIPKPWQRCAQVNRVYPHGVGRFGARDHVAAGAIPVKNFKHSNRLYSTAMRYNRGLDRDHDGIACEEP